MNFDLKQSIAVLDKTPKVLEAMLIGLSNSWLMRNEGNESWSPYTIVGHLLHGEKTDWMPRVQSILSRAQEEFVPFDRLAQLNGSQDIPIDALLTEFRLARKQNLERLLALQISESDLQLEGKHPEFGTVTLKQLIAAWAVHDLGHIAQISRVMAKQYKKDVGPWIDYMPILRQ